MAEVDESVHNFLRKIADEQNYVNYKLKIEPTSSGGANYTSTLYNVTFEERDKTHHMFMKIAAMGEQIRAHTPDIYYKEMFFYTKLAKVYENLQDDHRVPDKHRLKFSKFYGSDSTTYKEVLLLENLVMKGYQSFDRFKSIDWQYAASAVTELSKLHALSFALSEYYPEDFDKVLANFEFAWETQAEFIFSFLKASADKATEKVEVKSRDKFKKFFETFGTKQFSDFLLVKHKTVLIHGDFRPSNLMHRILNDGTMDIKILDLQTLQGASPVIDLLYFIFTGSDEKFRAQYYQKLIDHYYTELAAAMKRLHLDPEKLYTRAVFDKELKEKLPLGLTLAVMALPVVTVAVEDAPKVNKDMELSDFSVEQTSDLFIERLNGIINDFVKWGVLK